MKNLVWANIQHRPMRFLLTALGVALGTLLILLTVGLAHGFVNDRARREASIGAEIMVRSAGTFGSGMGSNQPSLPVSRAEELRRIPQVQAVTPVIQYIQAADSGFGFRAIEAVDFEAYSAISGIRIVSGGVAQTDHEINIDTQLAKERNVTVGSEIEVLGSMMKIAGIYAPECGARIKLRLPAMQERLAAKGLCSLLLVKCSDPGQQDAVAEQIQRASTLRAKANANEIEDQIILTRDLPALYSKLPALDTFLNVVIGVAVGISSLVILLAMYTTITERTREIGILKSLGATEGFILRAIESEALIISLTGALAGLVLSLGAQFLLVRATALKHIEFEPRWIGFAFAAALLGGMLGGLYPALRAARMDPIDALDHE
ncbi:MAG: ABC transporter permease [Blastocatellia bacterium]|nr:ABC transporter permease [Blastocatellia bacterium]